MSNFQFFKVEAPAGVNFAREPSQLNPQLWDEAGNVAFRHGITKKSSGYEQGFGTAYATPECIIPLREGDQNYYWWLYAGRKALEMGPDDTEIKYEDRVYRISSKDNHIDVTPKGGLQINTPFIDKLYWTGDSLNGVPYLCKDKPYVWDASLSAMQTMVGFPEHVHFKTMRTYRNFMVGLNFATNDYDGDFDKGFGPWNAGLHQNALWWSHDVVGSQLDSTVDPITGDESKSMWCDADPTRNSGWNFLGGSGGPIVDGRAMRDSFIIYRERSIWQMSYTGGINVFAFKELFDDAGVLGLDCIAEVEGKHFVVGQSDVYIHDGVNKKSVADGVIRKELFNSIDPAHQDQVFVATNYKDKELWVCIPESTTNVNGACNVAYVYNWEEQTWARKYIPDLVCSSYTILSLPSDNITWFATEEGGIDPISGDVNYDKPGASWEEATDRWIDSYYKYNPSQWGLALGSAREVLPAEENRWYDNQDWFDINYWDEDNLDFSESKYFIYTSIEDPMINGVNYEALLEKKWMDMGDRTDSSFVNKIYPLVRKGIVDVYMASSKTIDGGLSWKFIGKFDPSKDTKLSCRISGEYVHIKFIIPATSRAEIRGYWLEFGKIGRRS